MSIDARGDFSIHHHDGVIRITLPWNAPHVVISVQDDEQRAVVRQALLTAVNVLDNFAEVNFYALGEGSLDLGIVE